MKKLILTLLLILPFFNATAGFYAHHEERVLHPVVVLPQMTTVEVNCGNGVTIIVLVMPGDDPDMDELEATFCPIIIDPV